MVCIDHDRMQVYTSGKCDIDSSGEAFAACGLWYPYPPRPPPPSPRPLLFVVFFLCLHDCNFLRHDSFLNGLLFCLAFLRRRFSLLVCVCRRARVCCIWCCCSGETNANSVCVCRVGVIPRTPGCRRSQGGMNGRAGMLFVPLSVPFMPYWMLQCCAC